MPTAEVCRRHGLSPATFYKYESKYGGTGISDVQRLKMPAFHIPGCTGGTEGAGAVLMRPCLSGLLS